MEPVKGGMLANPPKTVLDVLKGAEPDSSAASWALRFAAGLDGVLTVLSGMSNEEQMRDNISCMKGFSSLERTAGLSQSAYLICSCTNSASGCAIRISSSSCGVE